MAAFEAIWRRRRKIGTVEAFEAELMRELVRVCLAREPAPGGAAVQIGVAAGSEIARDEADAWDVEPAAPTLAPSVPFVPSAPDSPPHRHGPSRDSYGATLGSLGLADRAMLVLHLTTDMTDEAIAAAIGKPSASVAARRAQIEAALAAAIARDEAEQPGARRRRHSVEEDIRRRLPLPATAPASLLERAELRMTLVSLGRRPRPAVRLRYAIPMIAIVAALSFVGSGAWRAVANIAPPTIGPAEMPGSVDAFGRIDARTAWATRGDGLYLTRDGGASWSKGTLPVRGFVARDQATLWPNVYYPFFLDANHGWLLSWSTAGPGEFTLTVHRTTDGGVNWTSVQLPRTYPGFGSVQFADERHGWLTIVRPDALDTAGEVGNAYFQGVVREPEAAMPYRPMPDDATTIVATSDGGRTWSLASMLPGVAAIRFAAAKEGWGEMTTSQMGSVDAIIHTTDGGRSWSTSPLPDLAVSQCRSVPAPRAPRKDGKNLELALPCLSTADDFLPQAAPAASVPWSSGSLMTLVSTDGGRSWGVGRTVSESVFQSSLALNLARAGPEEPLLSLTSVFPQPSPAVFDGPPVQASGGRVSFDGGASWAAFALPYPALIEDLEFTGPRDVWITTGLSYGDVGGAWANPGAVYSSRDAGATWSAVLGAPMPSSEVPTIPPPTDTPFPVDIPTPYSPLENDVVQAGLSADVGWVQTADLLWIWQPGAWTGMPLPEAGRVQVITSTEFALVSDPVPAADGSGLQIQVYRSSNGGALRAAAFGVGTMVPPYPWAHFVDEDHGFVYTPVLADARGGASHGCKRYATADAGVTWSPSTGTCVLWATFVDPLTGWSLPLEPGPSPSILVTTDGGATWRTADLPKLANGNFVSVRSFAREPNGTLDAVLDWDTGADRLIVIVHSNDGGRSWAQDGQLPGAFAAVAYRGGYGEFIAFGSQPGTAGEMRWVTPDRGRNWTETPAQGLYGDVAWVSFDTPSHAWAVLNGPCTAHSPYPSFCSTNVMYETVDGGATWTPIWPSPTT